MIRTRSLCVLLACLLCITGAGAADYVWKNVKVGGGGFIPGVVFSGVEPGLAYLRSDIGGAYRWDDKANIWIPLEDNIANDNYFGVESIAPDPVDANVVYAAVGAYRTDAAAIMRFGRRGRAKCVAALSAPPAGGPGPPGPEAPGRRRRGG